MSTTTFAAHNSYEGTDYQIDLTNGYERVSISMRAVHEFRGLGASMTPDVARALAVGLVARAEAVEVRAAELAALDAAEREASSAGVSA